jgi:hypothetical protein
MGREAHMSTVRGGFYFNRTTWDLVTVSGKRGELPVGTYVRLPTFFALLAAPVLGATLVLFLPFAGIALFLREGLLRLGLKKSAAVRI